MKYRIFPINENALTIDFGNEISALLNDRVLSLAAFIEKDRFDGFIESVPAYSSLTVFYDLLQIRRNYPGFPSAFTAVKSFIESALNDLTEISNFKSRKIKIPVCYNLEFASDLEFIANTTGLTTGEVIKIHTSKTYRVFMIGFLPAFAYMGEVDKKIVAPRRQTPRTKIEKGSVGIAGKQTGIYPLESPGGWQIIGKTPLEMFQPQSVNISFLQTGDWVNFYSISKEEFHDFKQ